MAFEKLLLKDSLYSTVLASILRKIGKNMLMSVNFANTLSLNLHATIIFTEFRSETSPIHVCLSYSFLKHLQKVGTSC